jgi:hypothetical protein
MKSDVAILNLDCVNLENLFKITIHPDGGFSLMVPVNQVSSVQLRISEYQAIMLFRALQQALDQPR